MKNIGKSEAMKALALKGDVEAQYNLGKLYCCGERPEFDNVEALKWWCMAAKSGQRDAMFEVGKLYETSNEYKGSIIPKDNVMAYAYYTLSHQNGNEDGRKPASKIKSALSKEDLKNAEYMLERWPVIGCEISR